MAHLLANNNKMCHEKTCLGGFPTRYDINRPVPPQKMARGLEFCFKLKRNCTIYVAKTKVLISWAVTSQVICVFVFSHVLS